MPTISTSSGASTVAQASIRVSDASKTFGITRVLHGVDLEVRAGEVHALIGENGCGKSTLIKGLAGFHEFDAGATLTIGAQTHELPLAPGELEKLGIRFIHQDLGLVPTLTVMENIALERGFVSRAGRISWRGEAERARRLLSVFGDLGIEPGAITSSLSQAQRAVVAIARALGEDPAAVRMLVLDEPTAALPEKEVGVLFDVVRRLRDLGVGVIFVSHRLEEIFEIADRVTVLRDGRVVATREMADLDEQALTSLIIGKSVEQARERRDRAQSVETTLEVRDLHSRRLRGVTLNVGSGEIVGVAGLAGSGRSELARILAGAQQPDSGSIRLQGEEVPLGSPRAALRAGVAYVPEDRAADGAIGLMSVRENLTLPVINRFRTRRGLDKGAERRFSASEVERYDVRPRNAEVPFQTLSGGNQQKVVLAKWMATDPRLLVLDEPVQGVDIGAREDIYTSVVDAAERGLAVLMINSDFADMARICDRVYVLRRGHIAAELVGDELTRHQISSITYASGVAR